LGGFCFMGCGYLFVVQQGLPKLLYENNVDEVCDEDFPKVLEQLKKRLMDFGIYADIEVLTNANVTTFHPSKNILLTDHYTSSAVIKELQKINLTTRLDLTKDTFRNEGHSLQLYSISHSLVIYDKMADLKKPKGRAIDKDSTFKQQSLFDNLETKKALEILRIEVRLSKKVKMNSVLEKYGYKANPTFVDIFQTALCQKIVRQYWKELVINHNMHIFSMKVTPQKLLERLRQAYPRANTQALINLVGLHQLCNDTGGVRGLRNIVTSSQSDRTWYRLLSDIKKLDVIHSPSDHHSWVKQIDTTLRQFETFTTESIDDQELQTLLK